MPLKQVKSGKKSCYQWGNTRTKYCYHSEAERKNAKRKAIIQAYAIEKSKARRGQPSELAKSKSTGRKTRLVGIGSKIKKNNSRVTRSKQKKATGSKSKTKKSGSKTMKITRRSRKTTRPQRRSSGSKTMKRNNKITNKRTNKKTSKRTNRSGSKSSGKLRSSRYHKK